MIGGNMNKSPSIEIFENVRQPRAVPVFGTGFATVGFSTNGPVNKLMSFNSLSDFNKYMGDKPVKTATNEFPFTHNMISRAMATSSGGTLYFMRIGSFSSEEDGKASVAVSNYTNGNTFSLSVKSEDDGNSVTMPWFVVRSSSAFDGTDSPTVNVKFNLFHGESDFDGTEINESFPLSSLTAQNVFSTGNPEDIYAVSISSIVRRLNANPDFSALATASLVSNNDNSHELKLVGKFVGEAEKISSFSLATSMKTTFGGVESVLLEHKFSEGYDTSSGASGTTPVTGEGFVIVAKNPGSAMNGFTVRKTNNKSKIDGEYNGTFNVAVYSSRATSSLLETFSNLTLETFVERINDKSYGSEFIEIEGYSSGEEFKEGTYILSEGEVLIDGTTSAIDTENTKSGTDGVPESLMGDDNTEEIVSLYLDALRDPSFLNKDIVNFSLLATPECGDTEVQDAAIALVEKRGDAVYLVDSPLDYMEQGKEGVRKSVDWTNGLKDRTTAITSSYALMYYGWLQTPDAFGSTNIIAPPSVLVLPKILSVDAQYGLPCYSPAGVSRGRLIASDFFYSPDIEDRELMCGEGNSLNPIIFSNTRGLMIFSQKTADRSNSAINRIHVRRMLNDIKRKLYTALDVIRFEVNNPSSQSSARKIVEDILFVYKNSEILDSYLVSVTSPGGAEADVLNITISLVPYGLIERIHIYLNIGEAGMDVSEV